MKNLYIAVILLFITCFSAQKAFASHIAGGEIVYSWLHDSTYHVTFKLYRDCSGIEEPTSVPLCITSSCGRSVPTINLQESATINGGGPNGTVVSAGCPGYPTTCNGGSLPGYREWWYEGNVTLPYRCAEWIFSVSMSARNDNDNLSTQGGYFYVQATLNNVIAQGNSSATFTVKPVPYVCVNHPYAYNNGAYDIDNDSLGYQMILPEASIGCGDGVTDITFKNTNVVYNLNNNPLATNNTFVLDTATGQLNFTPSLIGSYTLTLRVTEYRNGVAIGSTMRDIQVHVISCNITSPVVAPDTTTIQLVNGRINDCGGNPLHFCFSASSSSALAVLVPTDNHAIVAPGSTVTYTGLYTNMMYGCFTWVPGALDSGLKILTITVTDSSCAPPGITEANSFTLPIYVAPTSRTHIDTFVCLGNKLTLSAHGSSAFAWSVLPGGLPLSTLSCSTCQYAADSPVTTAVTTYIATSNSAAGCPNYDTVVVASNVLPPQPIVSGPSLLCQHDTLILHAGVIASTFLWTGPSGFHDTTQNPILLNFQPADTGKYYVIAENGRCASAKDSIGVSIYPTTYALNADTTICQGNSINLYGKGNTFIWSVLPGGSPLSTLSCTACASPAATPAVTTSYVISSVQVGCNTLDTVTATVFSYPVTGLATGNTPLCEHDTLKLLANTTAMSYLWTGPDGFRDTTQNPVVNNMLAINTGEYRLVAANWHCIAPADSIGILIYPTTYALNGDTTICQGNSINLNGVGATFIWSVLPGGSPLGTLSCTACANPVATPAVTTSYVISSVQVGCNTLDTVTAVVFSYPATGLATSNTPLCEHDTLKLLANTTAMSYLWTGPNGFRDTTQNPVINNVLAINTGEYRMVAANWHCIAPADSIGVLIYPTTYALNGDTTICEGSSIYLNGRGSTFIWSVLPGGSTVGSLSCTTCASPLATPAVTTSYVVSSVEVGCNTADTVAVRVNSFPPAPAVSSNTPLCVTDTLKLFAGTVATSYVWTGPNGFRATTQNPVLNNVSVPNSGIYYLVAANGPCAATPDNTTVLVVAAPVLPVVTTNSPLCTGKELVLTLQNDQNALYSWTGPNGFTAHSQSVSVPNVSDQYAGLYTVSAAYPANTACVSPTGSFSVVVRPRVLADFQLSKDSVCEGTPVSITYSVQGADSVNWDFSSGVVQNSVSSNPINIKFTAPGSQAIFLNTYNDACGDTAEHRIYIATVAPPVITATPVICPGDPVTVLANYDYNPDVRLVWNFGAAQVNSGYGTGPYTMHYSEPGTYIVSMYTQNAFCTAPAVYDTILAQPYPDATFTYSDITNICSDDTIRFEAADVPGYHYQWNQPVYFSNDTVFSTFARVRYTGYISLFVADQYGCKAADSVYVETHPCCNIYFPNAFTPNGDGRNDLFRPITIGNHDVQYFRVFNRWGQTVYASTNEKDGWNGKVDGRDADTDTYFYEISYKCVTGDYFKENGTVTLIR